MSTPMVLDTIGQINPAVLARVRGLAKQGATPDAISRELFATFQITVGRTAILRWVRREDIRPRSEA